MKKIWLLGLVLLVFSACSKKEEVKPVEKTGVELVALGAINFGGVLLGEYRDAAIRIFNYGPGDLDTTDFVNKMAAPFKVQSISAPCSTGSLPAKQNCIVAIRFNPTIAASYSGDFLLGSAKITTTGRGLLGGVMSISEQSWDVSTTIAGVENRKTFVISNLGDFTIPAPTISLPQGVSIGLNKCGSFIATLKECQIELVAKKLIAGSYAEQISFNSGEGGLQVVNFTNTVVPAEAAGAITFVSSPPTIIADGTTHYTITTNPIKDQYGNTVSDGTNIRINGSNLTLLTTSPQATVEGRVSFEFVSPQTKGFATVSLLSSEASGFLRALATSGPPSGTIEVQSYTNPIVANGQAQTLFKVLPLKDQFGNVVEDGTQVFYFVDGGGSVGSPFNFTLLGTTQMGLISSTIAGTATFQVRAGPIYDANNVLTGWSASGDYPITYIPGLASGTIPMTASENAIYAIEDQAVADAGTPIRSTVIVGPVKDAYGNIVTSASPLTLNLVGGKNVTFQNQNPVTVYTDNNGMLNFIVAGNGDRGEISANISGGAGASGTFKIWAFRNERITPNNTLQNKFIGYETFDSASGLPLLSKRWGKFGAADYAQLSFNDGSYFIARYTNSSTIRNWLTDLEFLRYPCWFSRKNFVQVGICQKDNYSDKISLGYNATDINGGDSEVKGPNTILNYAARHNPGERGTWEDIFQEPRQSAPAFIPSTNTYMIFGGLFYQDVLEHYCDRITLTTNPSNANSTCNGLSSCSWDNTSQMCKYRTNTSFIGHSSDWSSYFFDMGSYDQPTSSSFAYGDMGFDQVGDYPPSAANMSTVDNKKNLIYAFGGFNAESTNGMAYNQLNVFNGNTSKWASLYPEPDSNERGIGGEPSVRYQNGLSYVPETNTLYVAGGLKKYYCEEQITKGVCNQQPACTWNDYDSINCDAELAAGRNCYNKINQADAVLGEYCKAVSTSACRDIAVGFPPYNTPTPTLAQTECNKRVSCSWDEVNLKCNLRGGAPNGEGEGWTDAKDMWELNLDPLDDGDNSTNPVWKKLCDSQEPYLNGNPNIANPAYRSCGFPGGAPGVPTVYQDFAKNIANILPMRMNMMWSGIRQKMYLAWNGRNEIFSFDPYTKTFAVPTGGAAGLANTYQLVYNDHTGKSFAYKRGTINQSNSSMASWEADPNEKHFMRFSANIGLGSKLYAKTLVPIVRASGRVTGTVPSSGVMVYIYNFTTSQWVTVGSNSNTSTDITSLTNSEIRFSYSDALARDMISNEGKVEVLITVKGNPANGALHELNVESVALEGQF